MTPVSPNRIVPKPAHCRNDAAINPDGGPAVRCLP
jgi:hypothetical protein